MDEGEVSWEVFKPRDNESALSFTYRDESLQSEDDVQRYQKAKVLGHGDLPGLCGLTFSDFTVTLKPPLPPRVQRDASDLEYGHLHCVTDRPHNQLHMEKMAKLATRNSMILPFIPRKQRRDMPR